MVQMQIDKNTILDMVKTNQTSGRYLHTLGVQYTAACLAMRYEDSVERAELAGILHDCAKCLTDKQMLDQCEQYKINMSGIEKEHPYLLHGKLGAVYAKNKYKIMDEEIVNAVAYHTTGKPAMNLLEKIVFVADYIEPNRKPTSILSEVRRLAFYDIDKAVYLILEGTLRYLKEENKDIDTLTIDSYNYYKNELQQR